MIGEKFMHVYVARVIDTARISHAIDEAGTATLDFSEMVETLQPGDCLRLRWTTQSTRRQLADKIYIMRFWVTPFGVRKIRLQQHKIRTDGSVGPRMILLERHNGRVIDR